jgi:hypothetical protein
MMTDNAHDDEPITEEAQKYLDTHDRRSEQGLGNYPFTDNAGRFVRQEDGEDYNPDFAEVLRQVSSWFVKKDNKFYDVNNLQTTYAVHDIKQVVVHRIKVSFPRFELKKQGWKDFFKVLLDPPVNLLNPEQSIAVWSGKRVSYPGNTQKVLFEDGVVVINIWQRPAYRDASATPETAFWDFLAYVIPTKAERDVFVNWLAWSLQNEGEKPKWAIMLYSQKQGTGKTTLTDMCKALFGIANTGRTNGVGKLVSRFNKEVLENKLVIVEEVEVKKGSPSANSLKTLISEDSTMVEAKFMPAYVEKIFCAFIMTTNHLPLWLEEADRRFFILNFDHEGYNNGGSDFENFTRLVERVVTQTKSSAGVKGLYDELMARDLTGFSAHSLDVRKHSTAIMAQLRVLSPDVVTQLVEQKLAERDIVFVPVEFAGKIVALYAQRNANSQTYLFTELGWDKGKFAWDSCNQKWAYYKLLDPNFPPESGTVWSGHNYDPMGTQVDKIKSLLEGKDSKQGTHDRVLRIDD